MLIGILAGLATCALWGLTFVAARAVEPFTTWDLAIARYGIFGLASALLMLDRRFRPIGMTRGRAAIGLMLGGLGYIGYFVFAAYAVKLAGAALPPLIIGTMPILIALIANRGDAALPWSHLTIPIGLIAAGLLTVNLDTLSAAPVAARSQIIAGLACAGAALAIWVVYGLVNAAVMRSADAPDGLRWTGLQGLGATIGSILLLPFSSFGETHASLSNFIGWALLMGLAGSWAATFFWVVASKRLPLALAAQLIVAETVFGLFYGFVFEMRWPTSAEWVGCMLEVLGLSAGIAAFGRHAGSARKTSAGPLASQISPDQPLRP
ncbi:DMT family transporter [Neorhizobium alkalisoli]|uniref:Threonine/homoserine efflux transporter RhtA n=1 Tax=Neorhizobium alkalisoli TaxID=528178 RepID=A0A561QXG5_9HYPH|nr:DMT family transporter [Neorhizobium alkalisoli]TWF55066.1 threonine/homoserine efflux transporter RhtA [Neorhizobium alkalisoli]